MRLDKFICKSTSLTKAEAIAQIENGSVIVNGEVMTNNAKQVHENNVITLAGQTLIPRASRYIMFHKPLNTICSNVDELYPSILNFIDVDRAADLHIAGRLDADTTGLVLITDDGRWTHTITSPKNQCEKVYRVGLRDPISEDATIKLAAGVQLQGESCLTLPAKLEIVSSRDVLLTIVEGRFHQVKRMFAAIGNKVRSLHRERIGAVSLDIDAESWRYLSAEEVNSFVATDAADKSSSNTNAIPDLR